jgi:plasmid stabilization system protein ParE
VTVRVSIRAARDLERIVDYVSNSRAQPALDIIDEFEELLLRLDAFPELGELRPDLGKGARRMVLHRRWIVVYRTYGRSVTILRIRNSR